MLIKLRIQTKMNERVSLCPMHHALLQFRGGSPMLIKPCLHCKFHEIKQNEEEEKTSCQRENCYSRFSKRVAEKALETFLQEESSEHERLLEIA